MKSQVTANCFVALARIFLDQPFELSLGLEPLPIPARENLLETLIWGSASPSRTRRTKSGILDRSTGTEEQKQQGHSDGSPRSRRCACWLVSRILAFDRLVPNFLCTPLPAVSILISLRA